MNNKDREALMNRSMHRRSFLALAAATPLLARAAGSADAHAASAVVSKHKQLLWPPVRAPKCIPFKGFPEFGPIC